MTPPDILSAFSERVHKMCDELGIPEGHGRQTQLGKMFGVSAKAARKWLTGIGYCELPLAVAMCNKAKINVLWLLQGTPPMRGDHIPEDTLGLVYALEDLPAEQRNLVLEYARFQLQAVPDWFSPETLRRHLATIDKIRARPGPEAVSRKRTGTND